MMPTGRRAATCAMLSMTHMIVLFIVVLVVFGPHKLPELARGLGKLMAEFRKASMDFRSAFEQEMRDMERQALQAERKRAAEAAATAAVASQPASLDSPAGPAAPPSDAALDADARATEAPVLTPSPESVARADSSSDSSNLSNESAQAAPEVSSVDDTSHSSHATHDQQQPV